MNCERSALDTIASAELFSQLESFLDANASASRVLDIARVHSYLYTNFSTANPSVRRIPYCNASVSRGVVQSKRRACALNMIAPNANGTLFHIRTLFYLDKCALDYGVL